MDGGFRGDGDKGLVFIQYKYHYTGINPVTLVHGERWCCWGDWVAVFEEGLMSLGRGVV